MSAVISDPCSAEDGSLELLERRWFCAVAASKELEAECAVLERATARATEAWLQARNQHAQIESLRKALAEELSKRSDVRQYQPR